MDNDDMIMPAQYNKFLWYISWLSFVSGIFALYSKQYNLALVPFGVWLTSVNYWQYPDYSWRRYVDIFYVHMAMIYQVIRAYYVKKAFIYYTILFIGIIFYPIGVYYYTIGDMWMSTLCHSQIHIFGNISNIVLYYLMNNKNN